MARTKHMNTVGKDAKGASKLFWVATVLIFLVTAFLISLLSYFFEKMG